MRHLLFFLAGIFITASSMGQCLQVNVGVVIEQQADPCKGPIILDANVPGATYLWSTGETTQQIIVTTTDTFTVFVDNGAGCTGVDTVPVIFLENPIVYLGSDPDPKCGGCVLLDVGNQNGANILWSTQETSEKIRYCRVGTHKVWTSVTNNLGCTVSDTVEVTLKPGYEINLGSADTTVCGDSILITPHSTFGGQYLWSTGKTDTSIVVKQSGTYYVDIFNIPGCSPKDTVSDSIRIDLQTFPIVSLGNDPDAQCGGCVRLDAGEQNGSKFLWSTGDTTSSIYYCKTGINNVWAKVTSEGGCSSEDTVRVSIKSGYDPSLGQDITLCGDSLVIRTADVGRKISWSTGEKGDSIVVRSSGIYYVTITDIPGCSVKDTTSDTITVRLNKFPIVDLGPDPDQKCTGCFTLDAGSTSGATYLWSTGETTREISYCKSGQNTVWAKVISAEGCSGEDTISVSIKSGFDSSLGKDTTLCGDSLVIRAANIGRKLFWSTGEIGDSIVVKSSGVYYVTITDIPGCTVADTTSDTIKVDLHKFPIVNLGPDPDQKCTGCFNLDAGSTTAATYLWSTGETTRQISYCKPGQNIVWAKVTSTKSCSTSDTINLNIRADLYAFLGQDTTLCGQEVTIKGPTFQGNYIWNTGDTTQNINVNESGIYSVKVFNVPGCSAEDTISDELEVSFVSVLANPSSIIDLSSTCGQLQYMIEPVDGASFYEWKLPEGWQIVSGQGTNLIEVSSNEMKKGTISVKANNNMPNCASGEASIESEELIYAVHVPNTFTPNSDGINDVWVMRNIEHFPDNELIVLNRWGNEVYKKKGYRNNWDGSSLNEGTYFFKLKIKLCNSEKTIVDYLTIVR